MSKAKHLQLIEEKLQQRFNEISYEIKSLSLEDNEASLRKLIDERRQILDALEEYGFDPTSGDGVNALTDRFVQAWVKKILMVGAPGELAKYLVNQKVVKNLRHYSVQSI